MTIVISNERIGEYSISIEKDKESKNFKVCVFPVQSDGMCGYPIDERYYPTIEKAKRRYTTLKKRYEEEYNNKGV